MTCFTQIREYRTPGKLKSCFLPWEVEMVHEAWSEDKLIWPFTMDGEYSVHSAYHMLVADESHGLPSSSSPSNSQKFWKKIWKIKVPNNLCHFLWCAVKDSLSTKQNLKA